MTLKEFIAFIEKEDKRLLCFGTGLMAEEALSFSDIRRRVEWFYDNDSDKQGNVVKIGRYEYPVHSPAELTSIDTNRYIILITSGYYIKIREQILGMAKSLDSIIYDFPVLKVMLDPDSEEFFEERILRECLKEYEIVLGQIGISGIERDEMLRKKEEYIRGNGKENRPFVVPRTMIMPTTKCNLRCKGCSSLLPLFEHPQDVDVESVLKDCDVFFSAIDQCIRLTIGGEPFLYADLDKILKRLIDEPKLLGIMLITNGMKIPDESLVPLLKDSKVLLEISDYGRLEQMSKVVSFMEKHNINFKVLTEQTWTDMGGVEERGRSKDELKFVYLNCDQSRVIKGMHDGRFHTCARSARMFALGVYNSEKDFFDLHEAEPDVVRKMLIEMYYSDNADACDHCDLGALPTKVIDAGIQMNTNTQKSEYTIVKREELESLKKRALIR